MSLNFEELDYQSTPIGDLMLRRRRMPEFGDRDIYEVKLGEHFLMTSLFHEAESQLARLGLAAVQGDGLSVVVGGLGLGYTAVEALKDIRVSSLVVVDYLEAVIGWHRDGLVPLGKILTQDPRCRLIHADFFALSRSVSEGFDPQHPKRLHDAVLLDIDHTPTHVLSRTNVHFYTVEGLQQLAQHLKPGGVFALWADGLPDAAFRDRLTGVFEMAQSHTVEFDNPITGSSSAGTVYVCRTSP